MNAEIQAPTATVNNVSPFPYFFNIITSFGPSLSAAYSSSLSLPAKLTLSDSTLKFPFMHTPTRTQKVDILSILATDVADELSGIRGRTHTSLES